MEQLQVIDNTKIINISDTDNVISLFLKSLDVKETTKETYKKGLKQFIKFIKKRITEAERADILAFKAELMSNYKASTVSTYLTAVKSLYGWLDAEKIYPNIATGIKGAKGSRGFKKDTLTAQQAIKILNNIDKSNAEGLRNYALINLLLRTGIRTIEAERANIGDIRQEAGQMLLYIQGKGRDDKDDFVVLTDATFNPLQEYLNTRQKLNKNAPLFYSFSNRNKEERLTTRSIRRIIKNAMKSVGINSDRLTAHSLRHTAITLSLLAGASVQEAQQLARHRNVNTTLIYAHNIDRIAHAPEYKIDNYLSTVLYS